MVRLVWKGAQNLGRGGVSTTLGLFFSGAKGRGRRRIWDLPTSVTLPRPSPSYTRRPLVYKSGPSCRRPVIFVVFYPLPPRISPLWFRRGSGIPTSAHPSPSYTSQPIVYNKVRWGGGWGRDTGTRLPQKVEDSWQRSAWDRQHPPGGCLAQCRPSDYRRCVPIRG